MSEEERPDEAELREDELAEQGGEELPDRLAMSLLDANVAIPIDPAIAANVLSDESIAEADEQDTAIDEATQDEKGG